MLTQEPTRENIESWKALYEEHRPKLSPNKKSAAEIIAYLKLKYPVTELPEENLKHVVIDNIISNRFYSDKYSEGNSLEAVVFRVENVEKGKSLYENQDNVFMGSSIIFGIELKTAYFIVEGSSLLYDELFAFRGLDNDELNNFYLVAEYVSCLKRFDMLDNVLKLI